MLLNSVQQLFATPKFFEQLFGSDNIQVRGKDLKPRSSNYESSEEIKKLKAEISELKGTLSASARRVEALETELRRGESSGREFDQSQTLLKGFAKNLSAHDPFNGFCKARI